MNKENRKGNSNFEVGEKFKVFELFNQAPMGRAWDKLEGHSTGL